MANPNFMEGFNGGYSVVNPDDIQGTSLGHLPKPHLQGILGATARVEYDEFLSNGQADQANGFDEWNSWRVALEGTVFFGSVD